MAAHLVRLVVVVALVSAVVGKPVSAQGRRPSRWEIRGHDFRTDGVWRVRARAVRALRAQLLAAGQFDALNAPIAQARLGAPSVQGSAVAVSGVLKAPAILFRFKNSPAPLFQPADYDAVLFSTTPPAGRPYTYRSYYSQLSNGLLDIQGKTFGYAALANDEVYYTGGTSQDCFDYPQPFGSSNCNGYYSDFAYLRMQSGLREALDKLDGTIDFSQYADTSGFVPLVLFMQPAMDGACGPPAAPQNHLWSHRGTLGIYATRDNDPFHPGQKVKISDYVLQSGVGGSLLCTTTEIMPIAAVAHETAHGFGLPDLYDVSYHTEGVGAWSLMSTGLFTTPLSPARMDAWSLSQLGWVTVVPLTMSGTYSFDAAPLSDTAYMIRPQGTNTRGEYFLLENRQRQQADTALIRIACQQAGTPGCGGGLLIWHADSIQLRAAFSNTVNTGPIHGLALLQADGFGNLNADPFFGTRCPSNAIFAGCDDRGDAGDFYPGSTNNPELNYRTTPAAVKNLDSSFVGFAVDSIRQVVPNRTMVFRLRFGALTVVRGSDTTSVIQFDGSPFNVYRNLLKQDSSYTIGFTDPQTSADGRRRFHFGSWSDGGAQTHTILGTTAGGTITANLLRDFKLIATADTGGSIQADTAIDLSGTFIVEGRHVTLTATPNSGNPFRGWSGDIVSLNPVVTLPMDRPYTVVATFATLTVASGGTRPNGAMGGTYSDTLHATGGTGTYRWKVTSGALPPGLKLDSLSGVVSGYPEDTGSFSYTATVTSGAQQDSNVFTFSVSAPVLATADVVKQLLGPVHPLSADQVRYLDFQGNANGLFDVGDFLAWVKSTGAPLTAAVMQALPKQGGPR